VEKVLEQILEKLDGLDNKVSSLDNKVNSLDNKVSGMETDIKLIKTQQSEHGAILQAVRHAQETQKAQIDQLIVNTAHLGGQQEELGQTVDRLSGDVSFLVRKAAEHEEDIRNLRRAK
jgi:outer membrane murein-binding lipoprotein Lpp